MQRMTKTRVTRVRSVARVARAMGATAAPSWLLRCLALTLCIGVEAHSLLHRAPGADFGDQVLKRKSI